jgi:cytochrome P450
VASADRAHPDGEGFWSVATHAEVLEVLLDAKTYSSERGGDRPYGGTLIQDLPIAGQVLNMMDDPRHARIRRLVSSGLTPKMIRRVEEDLRARTRRQLELISTDEPIDFLCEIAAEIPMQMICVLMGIPEADRHRLFEAVEPGFDFRGSREAFDPDPASQDARDYMNAYGARLIAQKRREPGDDMLSIVTQATFADVEPARLTDSELYMFFSLLFTAGSETTRNGLAGGLLALAENPEQYSALRADPSLFPLAVEEILRWTTPSPSKRRTATVPATLAGNPIAPGEKVVIWEGSANRDERVFADADRFDITRSPNPHVGFGRGVHFCLGANLAKLEITVVLEEVLARFGAVRLVQPPEWTRSNRHTGLRHLFVQFDRDFA